MGKIRANAIEQSAHGQVVSVYDTAKVEGINYMISPDEDTIINDPTIDAVFICTPNYRIVPLCKQALSAGKHVFSKNHLLSMLLKLKRFEELKHLAGNN